jgi:hypothetical protein
MSHGGAWNPTFSIEITNNNLWETHWQAQGRGVQPACPQACHIITTFSHISISTLRPCPRRSFREWQMGVAMFVLGNILNFVSFGKGPTSTQAATPLPLHDTDFKAARQPAQPACRAHDHH